MKVVDSFKYMVDMYNQEAIQKQVTCIAKSLPTTTTLPKKKEKVTGKVGLITEQHYNNKYLGFNPNLTQKTKDKNRLNNQLAEMGFNYFAVYRPKLSKLNIKNTDAFINKAIASYELL